MFLPIWPVFLLAWCLALRWSEAPFPTMELKKNGKSLNLQKIGSHAGHRGHPCGGVPVAGSKSRARRSSLLPPPKHRPPMTHLINGSGIMRVKLKGLNKVAKMLANGETVTYWYAWKGGHGFRKSLEITNSWQLTMKPWRARCSRRPGRCRRSSMGFRIALIGMTSRREPRRITSNSSRSSKPSSEPFRCRRWVTGAHARSSWLGATSGRRLRAARPITAGRCWPESFLGPMGAAWWWQSL